MLCGISDVWLFYVIWVQMLPRFLWPCLQLLAERDFRIDGIEKHLYFSNLVWTSDIKIQISCVSIGGYGNLDSDAELDLLVVLKGFVKTRVVLSC